MTQKTSESKTVTKEIPIKLYEDDFSRLGKAAAEKGQALRAAKDEADRVKKAHKAKIDTLTAELDQTLRTIADGEEKRSVECTEIYDFSRNTVETFHGVDKVEERALEPHERQTMLFGEEKKNDKQGELKLKEKKSDLDDAVDEEIEDEDDKKALEPIPPLREQVNDEFKEASKIVKGW